MLPERQPCIETHTMLGAHFEIVLTMNNVEMEVLHQFPKGFFQLSSYDFISPRVSQRVSHPQSWYCVEDCWGGEPIDKHLKSVAIRVSGCYVLEHLMWGMAKVGSPCPNCRCPLTGCSTSYQGWEYYPKTSSTINLNVFVLVLRLSFYRLDALTFNTLCLSTMTF